MKNTTVSVVRLSVLFVLMAALALGLVSCKPEQNNEAVTFTVTVIGPDGTSTDHTVTSDAANLGDALLKEGIIEGNEDQYGLYITAVDGETADESKQQWWCVTKGGEQVNTSVSEAPIQDGDQYELTLKEGW